MSFVVGHFLNDVKEYLSVCFRKQSVFEWRTAVTQWFRRCATNRKVADSIPAGVIGIFH